MAFACFTFGQQEKQVADKIVAVVGNEIILQSDLAKKMQNFTTDTIPESTMRCRILSKSIEKKLLLSKARQDSVMVKSQRIENELNRRIQFFINKVGSKSKLEEYYDKSIPEIKEQMRQPTRELLLTEKMKNQILSDVEVTPKEVRQYFENLPKDSIPYFNTQVKLGHIVRKPKPTKKAKRESKQKLKQLRERIVEQGESFDNLAILYSDDESTATDGGDMGMRDKKTFNDKLAARAINLPSDTVSGIIKTEKGYHIVKLLDRKGDKLHLKHILQKPKITPQARSNAGKFLDSVRDLVRNDTLTFEEAAYEFSEDDKTKRNGGLILNKKTGSNKLPVEQLKSNMYFNIDTMKVGNISKPVPMDYKGNQDAYRILYLKERTEPHKGNLQQDYPRIRRMAEQQAKQKALDEWYQEYADQTYIRVKTSNMSCKALTPYLTNQ